MKPKAVRPRGLGLGYKTGADGYTGISVYLTTISTAKNEISESVEVNNPLLNPTQAITETVLVSIT